MLIRQIMLGKVVSKFIIWEIENPLGYILAILVGMKDL